MEGRRGDDDASFIASLYSSICSTLFCARVCFSLSLFLLLYCLLFVFKCFPLGIAWVSATRVWQALKGQLNAHVDMKTSRYLTHTETHTHTTHWFYRLAVMRQSSRLVANPKAFCLTRWYSWTNQPQIDLWPFWIQHTLYLILVHWYGFHLLTCVPSLPFSLSSLPLFSF